jgi:hypothetical protein
VAASTLAGLRFIGEILAVRCTAAGRTATLSARYL